MHITFLFAKVQDLRLIMEGEADKESGPQKEAHAKLISAMRAWEAVTIHETSLKERG